MTYLQAAGALLGGADLEETLNAYRDTEYRAAIEVLSSKRDQLSYHQMQDELVDMLDFIEKMACRLVAQIEDFRDV